MPTSSRRSAPNCPNFAAGTCPWSTIIGSPAPHTRMSAWNRSLHRSTSPARRYGSERRDHVGALLVDSPALHLDGGLRPGPRLALALRPVRLDELLDRAAGEEQIGRASCGEWGQMRTPRR